jgi:hypothetical protein
MRILDNQSTLTDATDKLIKQTFVGMDTSAVGICNDEHTGNYDEVKFFSSQDGEVRLKIMATYKDGSKTSPHLHLYGFTRISLFKPTVDRLTNYERITKIGISAPRLQDVEINGDEVSCIVTALEVSLLGDDGVLDMKTLVRRRIIRQSHANGFVGFSPVITFIRWVPCLHTGQIHRTVIKQIGIDPQTLSDWEWKNPLLK